MISFALLIAILIYFVDRDYVWCFPPRCSLLRIDQHPKSAFQYRFYRYLEATANTVVSSVGAVVLFIFF